MDEKEKENAILSNESFRANAMQVQGDGTENNPFIIADVNPFNSIRDNLSAFYKLTSDIDFNGEMITPIGISTTPFTGGLDGDGYAIKNFKINTNDSYTGLFRYAKSAKLKNLVIENGEIKQPSSVSRIGALAGCLELCITENISLVNISILGGQYSGTLAGAIVGGSLTGCSVRENISVNGRTEVGGLVGTVSFGEISGCLVAGNGTVSGKDSVGGLFGVMANNSTAEHCYAAIEVKGNDYTGGLIGRIYGKSPKISECYATGNVTGNTRVGGLIGLAYGEIYADVVIRDSFAMGSVSSIINSAYTGGLVGCATFVKIKNSYTNSRISTGGSGLVYVQKSTTVTNSYFDSILAGITIPETQARTTEEMLSKDIYIGWDWKNIWNTRNFSCPAIKKITDNIHQVPFELTYNNLKCYSIIIEWPDCSGATEYDVSYLNKMKSSTVSRTLIDNLIPGTEYEFRVRAKIGGTKGVWSKTLKVRTKRLLLDGIHSTEKGSDSITLSWNPVDDAKSYEVIHNNKILETLTNTCTITGLHTDITYVIRVEALISDGSKKISNPIMEKIYTLNPQTDYAKEFIEKCESQTWFIDEIENILNLKGKSITTINSKQDFATIYVITMADRNIRGKIPKAIGELFQLEYLYLSNNDLNGKLPEEIKLLDKLIEKDLSGNSFTA